MKHALCCFLMAKFLFPKFFIENDIAYILLHVFSKCQAVLLLLPTRKCGEPKVKFINYCRILTRAVRWVNEILKPLESLSIFLSDISNWLFSRVLTEWYGDWALEIEINAQCLVCQYLFSWDWLKSIYLLIYPSITFYHPAISGWYFSYWSLFPCPQALKFFF